MSLVTLLVLHQKLRNITILNLNDGIYIYSKLNNDIDSFGVPYLQML